MLDESPCPDSSRFDALLEGELSTVEEAELARHLGRCARCRARLDEFAGDADWIPESVASAAPEDASGPALEQVMEQLVSSDRGTVPAAEDAAGEEALDFLDPPSRPGSIGHFGPYEVIEPIGQGGMGIVLKVEDSSLDRIVAVKVLAPQLAASEEARKRFLREARAAAAVIHDHVVTIHAVDEAKGLPYLVMQYVHGNSLEGRLAARPLALEEILRIGMQIARGLAAAHAQGLIHRDIKPANILLENGIERVKITDFGLARAVDEVGVTRTGVVAGTPQYMAPEQARGEAVDQRADLFSLGCVLYNMCANKPPFQGPSAIAVLHSLSAKTPPPIRDANPAIPEWLPALVEKLLAKDPAERLASADEVAEILERRLAQLQQGGAQRPAPGVAALRPRDESKLRVGWRWVAVGVLSLLGLTLVTELTGVTRITRLFTSSPETPHQGMQPESEPTPPTASGAKFLLTGDGSRPRGFSTLRDAVAAAGSGDTIELRWNGALETVSVRLGGKALVMRAAKGHLPVLAADPGKGSILESEAPLLLEGIEFRLASGSREDTRRPGPPGEHRRAGVVCRGAPLSVANCRFSLKGPPPATRLTGVRAVRTPVCEIRNSLFVGTGTVALEVVSAPESRLVVENSVFAGVVAVTVLPHPGGPTQVELLRNTFSGLAGLRVGAPNFESTAVAPGLVQIHAKASVFDVGTVLVPTPASAQDLKRVVVWRGNGNLFGIAGPEATTRPGIRMSTIEEWNRRWGQPDSGSRRAEIPYKRFPHRTLRIAPENLSPEDFRIDLPNVGADPDTLGPGQPYDRWRETVEYAKWLERTRKW